MLRTVKSRIAYCVSRIAKDISLCVLSSLLLILSFPVFNFWLLAWFGFVPLFFVLRDKSRLQAFLLSYITGVIFWLGIVYWLVHVTLPGMILMVMYLALYFGLFGLIFAFSYLLPTTYYLLFIPSAWVILEYIRSHLLTGFPWALLGYSQYLNLPAIQVADITGAWGVSFLVMMVNVAIYGAVRQKQKKPLFTIHYLLPFSLLFLSLGYGFYSLRNTQYAQRNTLRISVIQGNIPQELKWERGARGTIMEKYLDLTRRAAREDPDLLIWPEAALPVVLEDEPAYFESVRDFTKKIQRPLLLGAVTRREDSYFNSALLVSQRGELLGRYDKLHLVPFGEYIPLRNTLRFLETVVPIGDISRGREYTIFQIQSPKSLPVPASPAGGRQAGKVQNGFAVLICFEDLFPELSRQFAKKGALFLVNITNDAWFKKTSAPYQHLQASVFRAVENRLPLVRAANTGVSGFIAASGEIISLLNAAGGKETFVEGYKTEEIALLSSRHSFYTRYPDVFVLCLSIFVLYGIFRGINGYGYRKK
jgi:apolipoprotein N-acyltransferase